MYSSLIWFDIIFLHDTARFCYSTAQYTHVGEEVSEEASLPDVS